MFDYKIIEKNRCQLGEAPIWHRNNKSFYWLDYIDNKLAEYNKVVEDYEEWAEEEFSNNSRRLH